MKQKKIIIGTALAALVVGIVAYVFTMSGDSDSSAKQSTQTAQGTNVKTNEHEGDHAVEQGNIYTLVDVDHAHECTFTYSGTNGTGTGMMYTNGKGNGLMTIDIKTNEGKTGKINTLLRADDAYGWTEIAGQTIGFKYTKSSVLDNVKKTPNSANSTATDPSQKFDLKCENWTVNDALFVVPSGVQFMSLPSN